MLATIISIAGCRGEKLPKISFTSEKAAFSSAIRYLIKTLNLKTPLTFSGGDSIMRNLETDEKKPLAVKSADPDVLILRNEDPKGVGRLMTIREKGSGIPFYVKGNKWTV